mgnify:CR=1 FL=1
MTNLKEKSFVATMAIFTFYVIQQVFPDHAKSATNPRKRLTKPLSVFWNTIFIFTHACLCDLMFREKNIR